MSALSITTKHASNSSIDQGGGKRRPIVNCGSSSVPVLNNAERVPAVAFGRFFLTLPGVTGTNGNPYAVFLGLVKRTDPLSTDMVQLNR